MKSVARGVWITWAVIGCGGGEDLPRDAALDEADVIVDGPTVDVPCEGSCSDAPSCVDACVDAGEEADAPVDVTILLAAGEVCSASPECASALCAPAQYGGVCLTTCMGFLDCALSETCAPVPADTTGDGLVDGWLSGCIEHDDGNPLGGPCDTGNDCRSLTCVSGQCTESCGSDDDCINGQICRSMDLSGASFQGCGYADRSGTVSVERIDLGTLEVRSVAEPAPPFAVPSDIVSIVIQVHSPLELVPVTFVSVRDPHGETIYDFLELIDYVDQPVRWRVDDGDEAISMLIPNSTPDRVGIAGGAYLFSLAHVAGSGLSGTSAVEVWIKRGDPDSVVGMIDLRVFLVGVGLNATQAAADERLQAALGQLDGILAAQQVRVGAVTYTEITGDPADRLSIIDTVQGVDTEMGELLTLGGAGAGRSVDVFLVREISLADDHSEGLALGVAGGIPGPAMLHGTAQSGVLITFDESITGTGDEGAALLGQVMAHEIGHYLGLFHVRESLPPCADGEGSTESDPCSPYGGGDVLVDTAPTDGANLMYYRYGGADGATYNAELTAGQGFVLRRHPIIQ